MLQSKLTLIHKKLIDPSPRSSRTPLRTIIEIDKNEKSLSEIKTISSYELQPNDEKAAASTNALHQYKISFPPGPMGLELEPVITSSERQIGCRVKDFYFGHDHFGISPEELQKIVQPGDVITHIEVNSVLSMPFIDILEKLKELKTKTRVISMKNISASCNNLI